MPEDPVFHLFSYNTKIVASIALDIYDLVSLCPIVASPGKQTLIKIDFVRYR